jgi:NADH-quinone oxidoreductase subunit J
MQSTSLLGSSGGMQALAFYLFSAITIGSALMVVSVRNPIHAVFCLILAFFGAAGLFLLLGAEFLAMILIVVYVGAVAVLFIFVVMMLDLSLPLLKNNSLLRLKEVFRAFSKILLYCAVFWLVFSILVAIINLIVQSLNIFSFLSMMGDFIKSLFESWTLPTLEIGFGCIAFAIAFLLARQAAQFVVHKGFFKLIKQFIKNFPLRFMIAFILAAELATVISLWKKASLLSEELTLAPTPPIAIMSNTHALGQLLYTDYIYVFQTSGLILLTAMIGAIVLTLRKREGVRRQNISEQVHRRREDAVELIKVETGQGTL